MLLPSRFCQPLAPRPEAEAFQRDVLFLEAVIGTLQFPVGRARFVKLTLQVAELTLQLVELLQKATEELLAGRQIMRDLIGLLHHDHIYASDGALGQGFSRIFENSPQRDQLARA